MDLTTALVRGLGMAALPVRTLYALSVAGRIPFAATAGGDRPASERRSQDAGEAADGDRHFVPSTVTADNRPSPIIDSAVSQ